MNEYQKQIIKLAQIEFEEIQDSDILIFNDHTEEKSTYYLYRQDGSLKDIQIGKRIDYKENKQRRPRKEIKIDYVPKKSMEFKQKSIDISVPVVHAAPVVAIPKTVEIKKKKRSYTLSDEQRQKRAEHMRKVAQEYWAKKKEHDSRSEANSGTDVQH